jgi:predicted metal-binding membrane protein
MTSVAAPSLVAGGGQRRVLVVLAALVAASWLTLVLWGRSGAADYLDHEGLARPNVLRVGLLAAGWLLMTLAMMLPASLPFLGQLLRRSPAPGAGRRTAGLLAGFGAVWLVFGVAVTVSDIGVHRLVASAPAVGERAWLVFPITLVVAGAYQLSRTKRQSLALCRDPSPALSTLWVGRTSADPLRAGLRHGVDCIGSCGGLMLVVFALGMTNLAAMAVGTAVTVVERRFGVRAVVLVGLALLLAAVFARVSG